ncbi:hypothetical protein B0H14DRAFT_2567499 [Mycena olivaceomarginata]|nr:hypothetical protein B0H14DRAFT_2567499 [Mycena olivaceomarginata]
MGKWNTKLACLFLAFLVLFQTQTDWEISDMNRGCRATVRHHRNGSGVRNQAPNGNPAIAAAAGGKSRWMSGVKEATGRTDKVPIHVVHRGESTCPEDDFWNQMVSRAREGSTLTHRGSECHKVASCDAGKKLGVVVHGGWWGVEGKKQKFGIRSVFGDPLPTATEYLMYEESISTAGLSGTGEEWDSAHPIYSRYERIQTETKNMEEYREWSFLHERQHMEKMADAIDMLAREFGAESKRRVKMERVEWCKACMSRRPSELWYPLIGMEAAGNSKISEFSAPTLIATSTKVAPTKGETPPKRNAAARQRQAAVTADRVRRFWLMQERQGPHDNG